MGVPDDGAGGHSKGAGSFGVVYANPLARAALGKGAGAKFPAGSVLVREKLTGPGDHAPQLLVVMFKRAPGFNPAGGDWEFLTVDGGLRKVKDRRKTGSCLECHASRRESDFVFSERVESFGTGPVINLPRNPRP